MAVEKRPFYVQSGGEGAEQVEAWSVARLPYMPVGWLQEFRGEVRMAVSTMTAAPHQILHAVYSSPIADRVDVENVLFYNVGTWKFAGAAVNGLHFERSFSAPPPCPVPLSGEPLHHHSYTLVCGGMDTDCWTVGRTLAEFEFATAGTSTLKRCASVWHAVKSRGRMHTFENDPPRRFGLSVTIETPIGTSLRPAEIIKPVFDGIISALHQHDGTDEDEVSGRLATELNIPQDEVISLLRAGAASLLGRRRVVHVFRRGVQWNPQDDICLEGAILVKRISDKTGLRVSGTVYEVD